MRACEEWIKENELDACAIQCWPALQEFYGIFPCLVMSIFNQSLLFSVCEADLTGALSMYALGLVSGEPSSLMDWNNNYGKEPDKVVLFHCSNSPRSFFEKPQVGVNDIYVANRGKREAHSTCVGRLKPGKVTLFRLSPRIQRERLSPM